MLMSASQWDLRLQNEYEAMCAFPITPLFSWRIGAGQIPPRVTVYEVTYNVRTVIQNGIRKEYQNRTTVQIVMPSNPGDRPSVSIIEGRIPFHPNIYRSGSFCLGDLWDKEPILWKLVINIGRILAFDPARTNPNSPANTDAARNWIAKELSGKLPYPCGETKFPHPVGY